MSKRYFFSLFIIAICCFSDIYAQSMIKIGDKVPEWTFLNLDKKEFSMNSWAGKVIQIAYVSPSYADLNDDFNDYLIEAYLQGRLGLDSFMGIGIVDCASSMIPNGIIRSVAGRKAKKYNTTVLFDNDATLQSLWGLPEDSYSTIIVDKNRVCKYIFTGKIMESDYEKIVQLLVEITK